MKFTLSFILTFLFCLPVFGDSLAREKDATFGLNQASPGAMAKYQLGSRVVNHAVRVAKAKYDFSVQGGAQGTGNLVGLDGKAVVLPNKALVVDCVIDVLTPATTSASGTIALGTGQTGVDLKAGLAAASYTGRVACIPVGSAATMIKLTADRTMSYTIATGAITAGKFWVYVYYIIGGE